MKSGEMKRQQYIRVEKLAVHLKELLAPYVQGDTEGFKVGKGSGKREGGGGGEWAWPERAGKEGTFSQNNGLSV